MTLDRYTVVLLTLRADAPTLDSAAAAALQDAHMAYLADLYEAGTLVAAGPLLDEHYRGLSILRAAPEEALALERADPAVQAGRFDVQVMPWLVPEGIIAFPPSRLPRSMAEVS